MRRGILDDRSCCLKLSIGCALCRNFVESEGKVQTLLQARGLVFVL